MMVVFENRNLLRFQMEKWRFGTNQQSLVIMQHESETKKKIKFNISLLYNKITKQTALENSSRKYSRQKDLQKLVQCCIYVALILYIGILQMAQDQSIPKPPQMGSGEYLQLLINQTKQILITTRYIIANITIKRNGESP